MEGGGAGLQIPINSSWVGVTPRDSRATVWTSTGSLEKRICVVWDVSSGVFAFFEQVERRL
jgi:hypothetical protein